MLSSSDAESVAVADLLALEPDARGAAARAAARLHRVARRARAPRRRSRRSTRPSTPDDVLVVSAAEEGIFLAYHALLEPGDHVVVETPCYESALEVARSAGAEVTEWRRSAADGWAHDLDALERALRPDTRLVYVNTPHNPTGTSMPRDVLDRVVELCAERGAWLFCDEVYRELEHDPADRLPAGCDLYERALSLGSVSKTYGLPGLRLGWLASRDRDALAPDRRPQALHDDLLERPERAPRARSRSGTATRSPSATAASCSRTCRCSTPSSSVAPSGFSWVRPTASPIGFVRVARRRRRDGVLRAARRRRPASCSCPAPSTTSPTTSGSATGGRTCPRRWRGSNAWLDTRS